MQLPPEVKKLSDAILDILTEASNKFIKKNHVTPNVLISMQIAGINFLGSVTTANLKTLPDKGMQLDYVNDIKEDVDRVFDQIKTTIKSVTLN